MLSEFDSFPIDPCIGTFENCLSNVDNVADIFVLIIGTRYGYVTDIGKSITNLEYLHAKAKGIPIFVFVDKQLHNNLRTWAANKTADFSGIVDNPKIFEFVSEIKNESQQWIYTYESVRDIKATMRHQLALIFSDGLTFKKIVNPQHRQILNSDLSPGALRVLIEKPFAWEEKFFAHVLKSEFDKLQNNRWDFQYGLFREHTITQDSTELLDAISNKINEILKLTEIMSVLLNSAFQDALGKPGEESDLDMMVYVSKQFASTYERMITWALYFKALHADSIFDHLLQLLYELPKSILAQMDDFVNRVYFEFTNLPDIDDNTPRQINLSCTLEASNTEEINAEIKRISRQLCSK